MAFIKDLFAGILGISAFLFLAGYSLRMIISILNITLTGDADIWYNFLFNDFGMFVWFTVVIIVSFSVIAISTSKKILDN